MDKISLRGKILNEEFFETLCSSIREGAAIFRKLNMEMIYCNEAWMDMFDIHSFGEMKFYNLAEWRKPVISKGELNRRITALDMEVPFTEMVEWLPAHGQTFWGDLTIHSFIAENEPYFLAIIELEEWMKMAEAATDQERRRFRALLENACLGILEANHRGEITNGNPFLLKLFGYEEEELLGKPIEVLIPKMFREVHVHHREGFVKRPANRPMGLGLDLLGMKKDGVEFPVEVSLSSYMGSGEICLIAFISDITQRKQSEMEIRKLNEGQEQSIRKRTLQLTKAIQQLELSKEELSRLLEKEKELSELKSRFVSMASHEFRTPLSTVLSSAFLLEKYTSGEDQPKRDKHLQRIISSVNMLTDILNDFLSVGRIEEGKIHMRPAEFNIQNFVIELNGEIRNTLRKGQTISYHHEGQQWVWLDASLLKHILMNLISNASKFSHEGSLIEVRTKWDEEEGLLSVRDQGMGISWEDQKHLMERFFRGTNATNIQGTGLGLHIVSKYAELMNGTVDCVSELEKGTEFAIHFKTPKNLPGPA